MNFGAQICQRAPGTIPDWMNFSITSSSTEPSCKIARKASFLCRRVKSEDGAFGSTTFARILNAPEISTCASVLP